MGTKDSQNINGGALYPQQYTVRCAVSAPVFLAIAAATERYSEVLEENVLQFLEGMGVQPKRFLP
jgi:hypothetical protein